MSFISQLDIAISSIQIGKEALIQPIVVKPRIFSEPIATNPFEERDRLLEELNNVPPSERDRIQEEIDRINASISPTDLLNERDRLLEELNNVPPSERERVQAAIDNISQQIGDLTDESLNQERDSLWEELNGVQPELGLSSDVYPVESWTLGGKASVGLPKIDLDLIGGREGELVRMSDGSFQLSITENLGVGAGIPYIAGVNLTEVLGVTFNVTLDELASGELGIENIDSISIGTNAAVSIENLMNGLGIGVPPEVVEALTGFELPDGLALEGGVHEGLELRRGSNETWEIAVALGVSGTVEQIEETGSIFGRAGDFVDFFTTIDQNKTAITRDSFDGTFEYVFDVQTGEFYWKTITEVSHLEGSGGQIGIGVPGLAGELVDNLSIPVYEGSKNTIETTVTETVYDNNFNEIESQETTSTGTSIEGSADVYFGALELEATHEHYDPPETTEANEVENLEDIVSDLASGLDDLSDNINTSSDGGTIATTLVETANDYMESRRDV